MELYSESFEELLGFRPYPGTLNARVVKGIEELRACLAEGEPAVVRPPKSKADLKPVLAYPAELKALPAIKVYLVRPLASKHGDDVVELVSDVSLRKALGLKDGDAIALRVCCKGGLSCLATS